MKKILTVISAAAVLFVSCAKEMDTVENTAPAGSEKIINTKAGADLSQLLVKLAEGESSAACLEGISGVSSIEKLFVSTPGNEELEKQFGLDRWYILDIEGDADIDAVVSQAVDIDQVAGVEFSTIMQKDACEPVIVSKAESGAQSDIQFNDPYASVQWHYSNNGDKMFSNNCVAGADINVKDVWRSLTCGDPSIIVAIVDEGVKYTHKDLAGNMWVNTKEVPNNGIDDDKNGYVDDIYGFNFVNNTCAISWDKSGDSGHGTHTAGTVAAVNNNEFGVCGVAGGSGKSDGCKIMSCQIFSGNGGGTGAMTARAVKYAADNGASVISCSFGYNNPYPSDNAYKRSAGSVEIDAINYFENHKGNNPVLTDGNIAIFSSGNSSDNFAHYPGAFYNIISVSAIGPDLLPTNYTNYGPGCNITAPGGELGQCGTFQSMVLSTVPSELEEKFATGSGAEYQSWERKGFDFGYMQGTSMACPHVSGVVALGLSYAKKLGKQFGREQFKQMILSSTNDVDKKIASKNQKTYVDVSFRMEDGNYKYPAKSPLPLADFYHKMGTGAIDAWQLMMKIEGTPCLAIGTGTESWLDLTEIFGTSSVSLTYLSVEVSDEDAETLGLQKLSPKATGGTNGTPVVSEKGYAYEQFGRLFLHPTKCGSGKVTIKVVGGGDHLGGGDNPPGGMEVTSVVSIIARPVQSNNGGWL